MLTRSIYYNLPLSTLLPTFKLRSFFAFCIYVTSQYQLGSGPLSKKTPAQIIDFGIFCSFGGQGLRFFAGKGNKFAFVELKWKTIRLESLGQ